MDELLKESNLTAEKLANLLNVTKPTIYNYKNSKWMKLNITQAEAIAKELKVKSKDLVSIIIKDAKK